MCRWIREETCVVSWIKDIGTHHGEICGVFFCALAFFTLMTGKLSLAAGVISVAIFNVV